MSQCDQLVMDTLLAKRGDRSWARLAADLGISRAYLSDIVRGNRQPGAKVLGQLGLKCAVVRNYSAETPVNPTI